MALAWGFLELFVLLICLAVLFGIWINSDEMLPTGLGMLTVLFTLNAILLTYGCTQTQGGPVEYLLFDVSWGVARFWLKFSLTAALVSFTGYMYAKHMGR